MQLATYVSDGSRSMGPHYSQYINTKPTSHKSANRVMHNLNLAHGKTFLYQFFYLQFFTIQFVSLFYYFTVCKKKDTHVCFIFAKRAHGKKVVCRVPNRKHTANYRAHGKLPVSSSETEDIYNNSNTTSTCSMCGA